MLRWKIAISVQIPSRLSQAIKCVEYTAPERLELRLRLVHYDSVMMRVYSEFNCATLVGPVYNRDEGATGESCTQTGVNPEAFDAHITCNLHDKNQLLPRSSQTSWLTCKLYACAQLATAVRLCQKCTFVGVCFVLGTSRAGHESTNLNPILSLTFS